jgi:Methyltransferase domain
VLERIGLLAENEPPDVCCLVDPGALDQDVRTLGDHLAVSRDLLIALADPMRKGPGPTPGPRRAQRGRDRRAGHAQSAHRVSPPEHPASHGPGALDLGSGAGIDVLLSASRVGPTGFVYGLDMTDEMLALAEQNRQARGVANARFLEGQINRSRCRTPASMSSSPTASSTWAPTSRGCCARPSGCSSRADASPSRMSWSRASCRPRSEGAWSCGRAAWPGRSKKETYRGLLAEAGFDDVSIEVTRVYDAPEAKRFGGRLVSAFVRATRPGRPDKTSCPNAP